MGTKLFFPPNNIGSIHCQNEKFPHQPLTRGLAFTSLCKKLVRIPQRNIDLKSGVYALDTAAESPTSQYFRTAIVLLVSNPSFMEVTKTYDIVASKAFRQCSTKASLLRSVSNWIDSGDIELYCKRSNRSVWLCKPIYRMGVIAFIDMPNHRAARRMPR